MKKFLISLTALVLFGCTTNTENAENTEIKQKPVEDKCYKTYFDDYSGNKIFGIEIEGHQYIIYDGYYAGNIIHAEHCTCHDTIK